jgi:hypothetical protein
MRRINAVNDDRACWLWLVRLLARRRQRRRQRVQNNSSNNNDDNNDDGDDDATVNNTRNDDDDDDEAEFKQMMQLHGWWLARHLPRSGDALRPSRSWPRRRRTSNDNDDDDDESESSDPEYTSDEVRSFIFVLLSFCLFCVVA